MTSLKYSELTESMDILKAREELKSMEASAYPNMKPKAQRDLHRKLSMRSVTEETRKSKVVKAEDLQGFQTYTPEQLAKLKERANGRKNRSTARPRNR